MSQEIVERVRVKYPTPLGPTHAACLIEIAQTLGGGAGLLRKDGGTNITLPDGVKVAQDIICYPNGRIFDCLGDGEGAAVPTWAEAEGSPVPTARYYAVSHAPVPPVPQPPAPQPPQPQQPAHSYQETLNLANALDKAYRDGANRTVHPEPLAHWIWRYQFEGFTAAQLITDARARGIAEG